jgi:putative addiction module killer protein
MFDVQETEEFSAWIDELADERGKAKVVARLRRLTMGLLGDVKPVGGGVSELRIDAGPGYRIYFIKRGALVILLLCGGDKGSQSRDIARARRMAGELKKKA